MKDSSDPGAISTELACIAVQITGLWTVFAEGKANTLSENYVSDCLFAVKCHLERCADALCECQMQSGKPAP